MKTLSPEEVCYVPDDLVEEGQERKLQKVSKFNDVIPYEDEENLLIVILILRKIRLEKLL